MRHPLIAASIGVVLLSSAAVPAAAADFDNATCQTFLTGTWLNAMAMSRRTLNTTIILNEGGTAASTLASDPADGREPIGTEGTWHAGPGKSSATCELVIRWSIKTEDAAIEVPVIDENTINIPSDSGMEMLYKRQPAP